MPFMIVQVSNEKTGLSTKNLIEKGLFLHTNRTVFATEEAAEVAAYKGALAGLAILEYEIKEIENKTVYMITKLIDFVSPLKEAIEDTSSLKAPLDARDLSQFAEQYKPTTITISPTLFDTIDIGGEKLMITPLLEARRKTETQPRDTPLTEILEESLQLEAQDKTEAQPEVIPLTDISEKSKQAPPPSVSSAARQPSTPIVEKKSTPNHRPKYFFLAPDPQENNLEIKYDKTKVDLYKFNPHNPKSLKFNTAKAFIIYCDPTDKISTIEHVKGNLNEIEKHGNLGVPVKIVIGGNDEKAADNFKKLLNDQDITNDTYRSVDECVEAILTPPISKADAKINKYIEDLNTYVSKCPIKKEPYNAFIEKYLAFIPENIRPITNQQRVEAVICLTDFLVAQKSGNDDEKEYAKIRLEKPETQRALKQGELAKIYNELKKDVLISPKPEEKSTHSAGFNSP